MSKNPLENIPITEDNNPYVCEQPENGLKITRFGKIEEEQHKAVDSPELFMPTGMAGDVTGSANYNKIVSIQGIPIFPNKYPIPGQTFIINKRGQIELRSIAKINSLTLEPRTGLTMEDGVLGVDCEQLIKHCGLITAENAGENFLTLEGGTVQSLEVQNFKVTGDLNFESLGEDGILKILVVNSEGQVGSQLLPDIFSVDLSTKSNTNADNINIPNYRTVLGINNVDNTSDANKPVSTATLNALNLKANTDGSNINTPAFRTALNINNVDNTSDANKPVSTATLNALNLKANTDGSNIDFAVFKANMQLNSVDNTSDIDKPLSTATINALALKANDNDVMKLSGQQTATGTKSFSNGISIGSPLSSGLVGQALNVLATNSNLSIPATDSVSVRINNSINVGIGLLVNTGVGEASGNLSQFISSNNSFSRNAINVDYRGVADAVNIINRGSGVASNALRVNSLNTANTAVFISGTAEASPALKVVHTRPGTADFGSAATTLVVAGSGTQARNIITINEGTGQIASFRVGTESSNTQVASIEANGSFRTTVNPTHPDDLTKKSYVDSLIGSGGGGGIANAVLTSSDQTIADTKTFTGNVRIEGTYSDASLRNPLRITPTGNTGSASTTGGALLINNTSNTGSAITVYSNQTSPSGHLMQLRTDQASFNRNAISIDYTGATDAINILNKSTTPNSRGINLTSTNESSTSVLVVGREVSDSTIKITHQRPTITPDDSTSSVIKLLATGSDTAATNIFATNQGTGKFATFRTGTEGTNTEVASIENNGLFRSTIDPVNANDLTRKSYVDGATQNVIRSNTAGITGATAITNIVQLSQANYDAIAVKDPNTLYIVNS